MKELGRKRQRKWNSISAKTQTESRQKSGKPGQIRDPNPEGCPNHPSYPAAHAVTGGAGVTMLKAFFNESFVIPSPVVPSDDGLTLVPYVGPPLTVGGELNKLAANVSLGREACGVHYRSDGVEGMRLGEAMALSILRDLATTYHEQFPGFSLTRFDGTPVTICPDC